MSEKLIGESIGRRYRILEVSGRGGLGIVYKALDTRLKRLVAVKVLDLSRSAQAKKLFLREVDALVRLKHPNIVQIYDAGETDTVVYLAFEYIEGRTLGQIMKDATPLGCDYAIEIIRQVATGLGYAHQNGVIHRDVKPSNILISNDGRVLLADFGLATVPGAPTLTETGTVAGTPAYMSPEQVIGKPVDARSDMFSLGIVFYELLTGRKPFSGESSAQLFSNVVKEGPEPPRQIDSSISTSINEIVLKSLAKEPSQRFQTADSFLSALAGTNLRPRQQEAVEIDETVPLGRDDIAIGAAPELAEARSPSAARHLRSRWFGPALAVLLLACFVVVFLWMPTRGVSHAPAGPGSILEHGLKLLAVLAAGLVLWLLWRSYKARAKCAQRGDTLNGPLPEGLDSRVTGRANQIQPISHELALGQSDAEDREATEDGLMPYSPLPSGSAEALPYPNAIAWLISLGDQDHGREIRLRDTVTIGSAPDNDIVLPDGRVSQHQAQIMMKNGRFSIRDLSSFIGTYVNDVSIAGEIRELHDRDEIEVGVLGANLFLFVQAISPVDLTLEAKRGLWEFDGIWDKLTTWRTIGNKEQFVALSRKLALGLLREAIGYSVESEIPYFQGTVGYMVEAPLLWIRHSRFPILFIAYDQHRSDTLETVGKQLQIAKATEFFALLVVVPTKERTGREADELRRLVADSVYRYDFVVLDRQSLASIIAHNSSRHLVEIILEQGIELASLSPYVVKGPVPGKMFFGREKEIKTVAQGIQSGDYAILGGRRIGKSSILQRFNRLLNNDPRYQPLYMDCEEKFNYEDLFQALADEFGEPLEGTGPLGFRRLVTKLKMRDSARQVVFVLDEVDALLTFDAESKPSGQLFRTFRALSHEGLCRFVFSGSRTLYRHLHNPHSPFFNFCEDIILKPLEQKSVAEIVSKPMHQLGIELPDEEVLIDRIINLSSSHPNIAQWLCDRLIKTASVRRITLNNLENISADPEFRRHYVQTAWSDSTALEKLISLVVEGPSFEVGQLCEALAHYGLTDKTIIRESVEMLQLCSLLECEGQRFRFALTHFPGMVRKMEDVTSQIERLLGQVAV
jgi:predicted Ser/Thr protein kinase